MDDEIPNIVAFDNASLPVDIDAAYNKYIDLLAQCLYAAINYYKDIGAIIRIRAGEDPDSTKFALTCEDGNRFVLTIQKQTNALLFKCECTADSNGMYFSYESYDNPEVIDDISNALNIMCQYVRMKAEFYGVPANNNAPEHD